MKIKWISGNKEYNITDFVSSIQWGGSASQVARTFEINVLNSPYDKNISDPNIKVGDRIKLYEDNKLLIDAMVYERNRESETGTITYSGYDDMKHLLRSNGTYNFKNITPEKITTRICNELKVEIGHLAVTSVNIKSMLIDAQSYYDIIIKAYHKAHNANGKKYMPIMVGRKLYVIEKGEIIDNFVLNDKINITNSSYKETLESMINKIKIYDNNGKQIGEINNESWINAYGIFQDIYIKEDGINANSAAKNMLYGVGKTASLDAIGNINCISGYGVKIKDTVTNLTGTFWIDNDSHTWENNIHTMGLELAYKNIMETVG